MTFFRPGYKNGKKTLGNEVSAPTNDRGEYRGWGLAPGRYYVRAVHGGNPMQSMETVKDGAQSGYAPVFFPNADSSEHATRIEVTPGSEISGIDFRLTPIHTVRVSGKITNPATGEGLSISFVNLTPRESNVSWGAVKTSVADDKGAFVFSSVTAGSYTISARRFSPMKPTAEPEAAQAVIDVADTNVDNIQLTFGAAPEINGSIVAEKGVDLKPHELMVALTPEEGGRGEIQSFGQVQQDGTFKLKLLTPDRYNLGLYPLPDGCYIKTIRYGDSEYPSGVVDLSKGVGGDFTVTIAGHAAQVDGNVKDAKDQPATTATVVLIPDDRDFQNLYSVTNVDQNGHFVIKGIKPGKYKLFAWDAVQQGQYEDPDFLKPYDDKGEALELAAGDKSSKDLKLIVTSDTRDAVVDTGNQ